jgi:hypothetical protein
MREVLGAAQDHEIAYVGVGPAEPPAGPNDWRRLLDLVEELGGSTRAEDLFRRFVLTADDAATLDVRAAARTAYAGIVRAGGEWHPPLYVRDPMGAWRFDVATSRIAEASAVLARRDELERLAGDLGRTPLGSLRGMYELAGDSLDRARAFATREIAAAKALEVAASAVAAPRAPFVVLGLMGEDPDAALAAARHAFSSLQPDAEARAVALTALIDGAVAVGRVRAIGAAVAIGLATILLIAAVLLALRRRRRRLTLAAATAAPTTTDTPAPDPAELDPEPVDGDARPDGTAPYATLADPVAEPEPSPDPEHGDAS